ncbi:predicted protein [Naegleria gruberi]|uniref:Predicted protein n=1 Tax=Naegleria gruberi TaxID=5762 RepID=D2V6D0_NAEGR|nr:uncharacterized protein NAEGRDRAFT_64393 [Naegleria gruberi]EFC47426.1 predicted protein [Naegleria gruberi]|eukprot:XP_002680170.1 predicted protein [Naegleria gruberi strain NEG-M]
MRKPDVDSHGDDDDALLDFITEEGLYEHDPNATPIGVNTTEAMMFETLIFNIKDSENSVSTIKIIPTENETLHYNANSLIPMKNDKIINKRNVITPKFISKKHCFKANHENLNSISEQVCKITALMNSASDSIIYSSIGTAVIVLNNMKGYVMAFTCAHVLYPTKDHDLSLVEVVAEIDGKKGQCVVVEEGAFRLSNQVSDDWVLLKIIVEDLEPLQYVPIIPSPSMIGLLNHITDSNYCPEFYTTLLFGYFVGNNHLEELKLRKLGLNSSDVWKLVPQEQMSASLGWTVETCNSNVIYNSGSLNSCSGGPVFKCRIKVEEVLECDNTDLASLMEKSYFSIGLLGLHCGGATGGNIICSSHNYFKSYYFNVYTPHKNCFSKEDQHKIEMEWDFINQLS